MVSIQLPESVAAVLMAQARSEGLSLEAYLELLAASRAPLSPGISLDEFERLLDDASIPGADFATTYARAHIYLDHD